MEGILMTRMRRNTMRPQLLLTKNTLIKKTLTKRRAARIAAKLHPEGKKTDVTNVTTLKNMSPGIKGTRHLVEKENYNEETRGFQSENIATLML